MDFFQKNSLGYIIGETGVAWDRGWMGQLDFKYVPDFKIKKDFYLTW